MCDPGNRRQHPPATGGTLPPEHQVLGYLCVLGYWEVDHLTSSMHPPARERRATAGTGIHGVLDPLIDLATPLPSMVMRTCPSLPRQFLALRFGAVTRPGLRLVRCWSFASTSSECCHLLAQEGILLDQAGVDRLQQPQAFPQYPDLSFQLLNLGVLARNAGLESSAFVLTCPPLFSFLLQQHGKRGCIRRPEGEALVHRVLILRPRPPHVKSACSSSFLTSYIDVTSLTPCIFCYTMASSEGEERLGAVCPPLG